MASSSYFLTEEENKKIELLLRYKIHQATGRPLRELTATTPLYFNETITRHDYQRRITTIIGLDDLAVEHTMDLLKIAMSNLNLPE